MTWRRDTPWRQGHILPPAASAELKLLRPDGEEAFTMVVSHDCDLAQDPAVEEGVEVMVGRRIAQADGNYSHAKNARRLHLTFTGGDDSVVAEFTSDSKRIVSKERLSVFSPLNSVRATPSERVILQRWLASRYRRSSFPDEFDRRLDALGLREAIAKALKKHGRSISAIYFDVDGGDEVKRSEPQDTYALSIYLLFDTSHDADVAEKAGMEAATAILEVFKKKCCSIAGVWHDIQLLECEVVSDRVMTVQQADSLQRWSADHLSLRATPPAVMRQDD